MRKLSPKQQQIYDFIVSFTSEQGYPPSIREICAAVGLSSPSSVHAHIKKLSELGYVSKDDHKTRALSAARNTTVERVPILGRVTAGLPALAAEDVEGYVPFDPGGMVGEFFALRVSGESMTGAGINDGDIVVVRRQQTALSGEIVVALIEDSATVKRLLLERGHVTLMPENPLYPPLDGDECMILGVVKALYRTY